MLRCQLTFELCEIARRMTHAKAAKRLGITHSRLNDLLSGHGSTKQWRIGGQSGSSGNMLGQGCL